MTYLGLRNLKFVTLFLGRRWCYRFILSRCTLQKDDICPDTHSFLARDLATLSVPWARKSWHTVHGLPVLISLGPWARCLSWPTLECRHREPGMLDESSEGSELITGSFVSLTSLCRTFLFPCWQVSFFLSSPVFNRKWTQAWWLE